jgi:catechol 2,3-dioxygenase-like lactoylglutathione lyase family enzyme
MSVEEQAAQAAQADVPAIAELGHIGIRCTDLEAQLAFYTQVLNLTVTDHDPGMGIYFLSSRPDFEHHEVLLAKGRTAGPDVQLIQQVSFRCARLEDVLGYLRRFRATGTKVDQIVSHGNAIGVYFFDPDGNRCEVYWQTGFAARQPFVQHIDLDRDLDEVLDDVRRSVKAFGDTGFKEDSYTKWVAETGAKSVPGDDR